MGLISMLTLLWARYEINKAKEFSSPSLLADGKDFQIDFLSSMVVLCSSVGDYLNLNLHKTASVIVVLFIAKTGFEILKNSIRVLLDASFDFVTLDKIKNIIKDHNEVKTIKSLLGRNSGSFKFIEAEIQLKGKDFKKAHSVCDKIEASIKKEISNVDKVIIHYEPLLKKAITYAVPLENKGGEISEHFGKAPYLFIITINKDRMRILASETMENSFVSLEKQKGIRLSEFLVSKNVDILILRNVLTGGGQDMSYKVRGSR
jgi:hypothetical protein